MCRVTEATFANEDRASAPRTGTARPNKAIREPVASKDGTPGPQRGSNGWFYTHGAASHLGRVHGGQPGEFVARELLGDVPRDVVAVGEDPALIGVRMQVKVEGETSLRNTSEG